MSDNRITGFVKFADRITKVILLGSLGLTLYGVGYLTYFGGKEGALTLGFEWLFSVAMAMGVWVIPLAVLAGGGKLFFGLSFKRSTVWLFSYVYFGLCSSLFWVYLVSGLLELPEVTGFGKEQLWMNVVFAGMIFGGLSIIVKAWRGVKRR